MSVADAIGQAEKDGWIRPIPNEIHKSAPKAEMNPAQQITSGSKL
jgi:hypothetical protein